MSTNQMPYRQCMVEAASALTSVFFYHPFRVVATRMMAKEPVNFTVRALYGGFGAGALGAHQLFLMGFAHSCLKNEGVSTVAAAVMAGVVSAPTMTAVEMAGVKKQLQRTGKGFWFRGFTPMVFRQIPVSLSLNATDHSSTASVFLSGAFGAVCSHYPDTVRVLMQKDVKMSLLEACRAAFLQMRSQRGLFTLANRVAVVGIAAVMMPLGRTFYKHLFNPGERV